MADSENTTIAISLYLRRDTAMALACLVARLGEADCARFAALNATYGDRPGADVMWSALLTLQGALLGAGFAAQ
jgi:hypothetical protein